MTLLDIADAKPVTFSVSASHTPQPGEVRPAVRLSHAACILIADDDELIREMIGEVLTDEGYAVQLAGDGEETLRAFASGVHDLLLLDVEMPEPDGFEVCRRIQETGPLAPPVIFLTGRAATADRVKGLDAGAVDYLIKPFEPDELRARVRAALRTKAAREALKAAAPPEPAPPPDLLSGTLSRLELLARMEDAVAATQRAGTPLALLMLEIDDLRRIREQLGSVAADAVLEDVTERAREVSVRTRGFAGRAVDGTFVLLFTHVSASGALGTAEELRRSVSSRQVSVGQAMAQAAARLRSAPAPNAAAELCLDAPARQMRTLRERVESAEPPMTALGLTLSITVSAGVACWQPGQFGQPSLSGGLAAKEIIGAASEALDRARLRGRDRVVLAPSAFRQIWSATSGGSATSTHVAPPQPEAPLAAV